MHSLVECPWVGVHRGYALLHIGLTSHAMTAPLIAFPCAPLCCVCELGGAGARLWRGTSVACVGEGVGCLYRDSISHESQHIISKANLELRFGLGTGGTAGAKGQQDASFVYGVAVRGKCGR